MYPRLPEMNKLSKYRISRNEIGRGAFSKVYVAIHIKTNTKTAMKIVKLKNLEKSFYQLCINEVSLLKSIKSPHVLQYIDSFITYDSLHLTTEFIDGPDLAERIQVAREKGKFFSERTVWYLFHQICAGLKDLHEHRILHRGF
uniref:non-specific serine/threonine protein kinase n=1 Tax=Panagrolaimus davidi TaxID=227884 RepID=A0A914Q2M4_9BILA